MQKKGKTKTDQVWKDHYDGHSCRYGCVKPRGCSRCALRCKHRLRPPSILLREKLKELMDVLGLTDRDLQRISNLHSEVKTSIMEKPSSISVRMVDIVADTKEMCKGCVGDNRGFTDPPCSKCTIRAVMPPSMYKKRKVPKK